MSAWPWESSESTDKVVPAFVAALQGVENVARGSTVNAGAMRYSYAELDAVLDACKPVLTEQGLAVTQPATSDGVHAIVMHTSGQWLAFPPLQVSTQQSTPQGQGSALTYARRYQMLALLNIATEDDDAQTASKPRKTAASRPQTAPQAAQTGIRPSESGRGAQGASPAQIRMMMALFNGFGITDRSERLDYVSATVGRPVGSSNELSKAEMTTVIDALKAIQPTSAQLNLVPGGGAA